MDEPKMKKDDIIRMAREAGFELTVNQHGNTQFRCFSRELEHFANLVAAAEREAIAQMIEDAPPLVDFCKNEQNGCLVCGFTPKFAAAAIRAKGQA